MDANEIPKERFKEACYINYGHAVPMGIPDSWGNDFINNNIYMGNEVLIHKIKESIENNSRLYNELIDIFKAQTKKAFNDGRIAGITEQKKADKEIIDLRLESQKDKIVNKLLSMFHDNMTLSDFVEMLEKIFGNKTSEQ